MDDFLVDLSYSTSSCSTDTLSGLGSLGSMDPLSGLSILGSSSVENITNHHPPSYMGSTTLTPSLSAMLSKASKDLGCVTPSGSLTAVDNITSNVLISTSTLQQANRVRKCASDDVKLLDDEQFDFDLPISPDPLSTKSINNGLLDPPEDATTVPDNDDDEIFFGPVGHTEKCVAVVVSADANIADQNRPLAPLTAAEMALLCQEAFTVASRIELDMKKRSDDLTLSLNSHSTVSLPASITRSLASRSQPITAKDPSCSPITTKDPSCPPTTKKDQSFPPITTKDYPPVVAQHSVQGQDVKGLAVDANGVALFTGCTGSSNLDHIDKPSSVVRHQSLSSKLARNQSLRCPTATRPSLLAACSNANSLKPTAQEDLSSSDDHFVTDSRLAKQPRVIGAMSSCHDTGQSDTSCVSDTSVNNTSTSRMPILKRPLLSRLPCPATIPCSAISTPTGLTVVSHLPQQASSHLTLPTSHHSASRASRPISTKTANLAAESGLKGVSSLVVMKAGTVQEPRILTDNNHSISMRAGFNSISNLKTTSSVPHDVKVVMTKDVVEGGGGVGRGAGEMKEIKVGGLRAPVKRTHSLLPVRPGSAAHVAGVQSKTAVKRKLDRDVDD